MDEMRNAHKVSSINFKESIILRVLSVEGKMKYCFYEDVVMLDGLQ